jgi:hypothetical protein
MPFSKIGISGHGQAKGYELEYTQRMSTLKYPGFISVDFFGKREYACGDSSASGAMPTEIFGKRDA